MDITTEGAILHLMEKGVVVECNGHHIYKSKRRNKPTYTVLRFDGQGNMMHGHDQDFPEAKDAIEEFLKRTHLS